MIKVGVIGLGYWGPNLVRSFNSTPGLNVSMACDLHRPSLEKIARHHQGIKTTPDFRDITRGKDIDLVAIATPVSSHFELAKDALLNGKHVFVEKPFTSSVGEAQELIEIAEKKNLMIMVDHTFLFTASVRKIKEVIDQGTLGEIKYIDSVRVNLGLFQHDTNVVWDLAPHDFSILDYILKEKPKSIIATAVDHYNRNIENLSYITIFYEKGIVAHLNLNWLSPVKIRQVLIGGEDKMLVWNDLLADEKIKIYDKGIDIVPGQDGRQMQINYRAGDAWVPKLDGTEALRVEANYLVECLEKGITPFNDGHSGLRTIKLLEATNKSIRNKFQLVEL